MTAVNDAPVLGGSNNLIAINRNPQANPGTRVVDLIAGHVTDVDTGAQAGIAVIGLTTTSGIWEYSTNGGGSWTDFVASMPARRACSPRMRTRWCASCRIPTGPAASPRA